MEWNLEQILSVRKPEELKTEPPFKAKILDVRAEVREFQGKEVPQIIFVLRRLATQQDDGTWKETVATKPFSLYVKYSDRKNSKYGALTDALWKTAPKLMQNAKGLTDLKGGVFIWETKEQKFGNIVANVTLPTKFIDIEPITEEEKEMLTRKDDNDDTTDEVAKEFTNDLDEIMG